MKKVGLVLAGTIVLACGAVAPAALGSNATTARHPAKTRRATIQIKSLTKSLLGPSVAHSKKGWITKGGTPRGKCSGNTAAGALDTATHGRWTGKYYASIPGIFVTSILGVKPTGSDYWGVYVNGKAASVGICAIKLHAGERLLFKIVK